MQGYEAFWLGLTQGLTEFIPVSSSGHLEILQEIMGGRSADFHLFLEFINLGTLLALIIYYRKRIWEILTEVFVKHNLKFARNIIITCIPVVLAGVLFSDLIESNWFFSNMITIACAMALIGFAMIFIEKIPKLKAVKDDRHLSWRRALGIGCAQCFALIPGTSRSGATIVAGRIAGLNNKSAADYSFTVSLIVMAGVMCKSLLSSSSRAYIAANWQMLTFANVVALISGLLAINFVMKFLQKKGSLEAFGYYRVALAAVVVIFELLK